MAKKCPQNCGTFPDDIRRCPKCNSFLLKLPDRYSSNLPPIYQAKGQTNPHASAHPSPAPVSPPVSSPPVSPDSKAKNDCYPFASLPVVEGRVKNFTAKALQRSRFVKFWESVIYGAPMAFSDTMNTFQVFTLNKQGLEEFGAQVTLNGDIIDGELYNGNVVRVWGRSPNKGSIRARNIYNVTSGILVRTSFALPSTVTRTIAGFLGAGVIMIILNPYQAAMLAGTAVGFLLIAGVIYLAIRITIWRYLGPKRERRRWW